MTVRVAISDPCLLQRLIRSLEEHTCTVRGLSDRALEVTSIADQDVGEARLELEFFLRAWRNAYPGAELLFA